MDTARAFNFCSIVVPTEDVVDSRMTEFAWTWTSWFCDSTFKGTLTVDVVAVATARRSAADRGRDEPPTVVLVSQ